MFWLTILTAIILRIYLIARDSVPFAYDMGRDLLWAKDIVFYHTPTLIGPAASIWGVYFGPFWFYFLSIPLLISGGNPLSAVYLTAAVVISTGLLAYLLFKKYLSSLYALTLAIVIIFSFTLINISTFAFHANTLPLLSLLAIYFCFLAVSKNPIFLAASFFTVSLMFHADPAPAVVATFVPLFIFFYFKLYKFKNWPKTALASLLAYTTPFIPQVVFEIRNNFVEVKSLIAYFQGQNPSLSGQLPIFERIFNRPAIFFEFFKASFAPGSEIVALAFLLMIIFGIYKFWKQEKNKKLINLFKINLSFVIIFLLIFTFPITVEIKNWYLHGFSLPWAFLIVFALYGLRPIKPVLPIFVALYLTVNLFPLFKEERLQQSKNDPAQLANQIAALDLIYNDTKSTPFSVYIFTPSIYDLHYQYLFWWQGVKLKKGLPADFAYLPNQPEYVRNKQNYQKVGKQTQTIYLIIENSQENEFYTKANWLANFQSYNLIWEENINNAITVQKRKR